MFVYVPPPPSTEARELGERLTQTVRTYRAEHPGVSSADVGRALHLARETLAKEAGGSGGAGRVAMVALGLAGLAAGATLWLLRSGVGAPITWMVLVALVIVGLLALVLARR